MELTESSPDEQWRAAAKSTELFVLRIEGERGVSAHLMRWEPPPKRANRNGATGYAVEVEARPAGLALGGSHATRLHVCRHRPCRANHHPSKYGDQPCVEAHGRICGWGRACWEQQAAAAAAKAEDEVGGRLHRRAGGPLPCAVRRRCASRDIAESRPSAVTRAVHRIVGVRVLVRLARNQVPHVVRGWLHRHCRRVCTADRDAPLVRGDFPPMRWSRARAPKGTPTSPWASGSRPAWQA